MSTNRPHDDVPTDTPPGPPPQDEGGDPACWAHLFDDDTDPGPPHDGDPHSRGATRGD
jgi:hypothetical protein